MSQSVMKVMQGRDLRKTSARQKITHILSQAGIYLFLLLMAAMISRNRYTPARDRALLIFCLPEVFCISRACITCMVFCDIHAPP